MLLISKIRKNWLPLIQFSFNNKVQNEIKKSGLDIKKDLNLKEIIKDTEEEISQPLDQVMTDVENSINYTPNKKTFEETDHTQTSKKDKNG